MNRPLLHLLDKLRGRRTFSLYNELLKTQKYSAEQHKSITEGYLAKLLSIASTQVPFYKEYFKNNPYKSPDSLSSYPIMTKALFKEGNLDRLLVGGKENPGWTKSKTGGSTTGEPMVFFMDNNTMDWSRASYYRGMLWSGTEVGQKALSVWGQALASANWKGNLRKKINEALLNWQEYDAFQLDNRKLNKLTSILASNKVKFLYGYVSSIIELCDHLKNKGIEVTSLNGVMTTAEVLLPEYRKKIEQTFGTEVYDGYGCGEVNSIAYECKAHNGLHISTERCIVEVLDDYGKPLPYGELGDLAITDLHNYAMPFIRYVNGDRGILTNEKCSCGLNLPRIVRLEGRTCDIIDGINGNKVHSYFFASMFANLGWREKFGLKTYQIIQTDEQNLDLYLSSTQEIPGEDLEELKQVLHKYLGDMSFNIKPEENLQMSSSGKTRWTMNKLRT